MDEDCRLVGWSGRALGTSAAPLQGFRTRLVSRPYSRGSWPWLPWMGSNEASPPPASQAHAVPCVVAAATPRDAPLPTSPACAPMPPGPPGPLPPGPPSRGRYLRVWRQAQVLSQCGAVGSSHEWKGTQLHRLAAFIGHLTFRLRRRRRVNVVVNDVFDCLLPWNKMMRLPS